VGGVVNVANGFRIALDLAARPQEAS
jgi:hypothetical protein